jgi:hypothetical protein
LKNAVRNQRHGLVKPLLGLLVEQVFKSGPGCVGGPELLHFGNRHHKVQARSASKRQGDGQIDRIVAPGIG